MHPMALDETMVTVLVNEVGGQQHLAYQVSKVLQDEELNYPQVEKLFFIVATRIADRPLKDIMRKLNVSKRMIK